MPEGQAQVEWGLYMHYGGAVGLGNRFVLLLFNNELIWTI